MGGRQVQKWDPSVHEDILISLFQHLSLSAGEWAALMNDMQAKGYTFTEGALRRGWNAATHEALLLCIIDEVKPSKALFTKVTEKMQALGYTYSFVAILQHVQKLRKNRDMSAMAKAPGDNDTPAKPAAKRGGGGGRGRKAASKKDEREFTPVDDEEERMNLKREASEELEVETPIKKQRTIKAEDHEGSAEFADYDAELDDSTAVITRQPRRIGDAANNNSEELELSFIQQPNMAVGEKKWDAAAERDLCVAIIMGNQEGRTNYNWPKVHAFLTQLGYKFTKDAISQHFTKVVMKDFKQRHGDEPSKSGASTPKKPGTPRAASTPAKRKTPASAKSAKSFKSAEFISPEDDDDCDDDDDSDVPLVQAKRVKTEQAAKSPCVKDEPVATRARSETVRPDDAAFQAWLEKTGS
ncbi:C-myc promoter-binding protein [Purpureocillium lavendulum]|uniref:C-myc promoter-binding protein n=1 Tax=Purpureocillium lavendulum TaxID=1247861 RepID=A0AB34FRT7_9HYPO|nr:C-myc promoter-binding protein [Purpureocillium lavendulum]